MDYRRTVLLCQRLEPVLRNIHFYIVQNPSGIMCTYSIYKCYKNTAALYSLHKKLLRYKAYDYDAKNSSFTCISQNCQE